MTWVLVIGGAWLTVALAAALLIAGAIRFADSRRYVEVAASPVPRPPAASPAPGPLDGGASPVVRHATAAPAVPRFHPGDPVRRRGLRHQVRLTAVRDPLNAAERVPPSHFGTP